MKHLTFKDLTDANERAKYHLLYTNNYSNRYSPKASTIIKTLPNGDVFFINNVVDIIDYNLSMGRLEQNSNTYDIDDEFTRLYISASFYFNLETGEVVLIDEEMAKKSHFDKDKDFRIKPQKKGQVVISGARVFDFIDEVFYLGSEIDTQRQVQTVEALQLEQLATMAQFREIELGGKLNDFNFIISTICSEDNRNYFEVMQETLDKIETYGFEKCLLEMKEIVGGLV